MLLKVIGLLVVICVLIALIYLLGMVIYNHFINERRKELADIQYHSDRLDQLIKKAENEL